MRYLNLSKGFYPYTDKNDPDNIEFESFTFNGGEPHIKLSKLWDLEKVAISIRINSFNDLGLLAVAVDALNATGLIDELYLFVPYFPAARQDRRMVEGEPLTVKVYADIINSMEFDEVYIFDPHSDVAPALIDNCTILNNHRFVEEVVQDILQREPFHHTVLVSPDAGANKKIHAVARATTSPAMDIIFCDKNRDTNTGKINGFVIHNIAAVNDKICIIVDDICDNGGTFIGLANELEKQGARAIYLVVSHGIFPKDIETLTDIFDGVYTTDSIRNKKKGAITYKLKENETF